MGCKSRSSLPQSLGFEKGKRNIFIGLLINMVFPVGAVLRACFKEVLSTFQKSFRDGIFEWSNGKSIEPPIFTLMK